MIERLQNALETRKWVSYTVGNKAMVENGMEENAEVWLLNVVSEYVLMGEKGNHGFQDENFITLAVGDTVWSIYPISVVFLFVACGMVTATI